MYASGLGASASGANNPFISDSSAAQNRYPDISSPDPSSVEYTSWMQAGANQPGVSPQPGFQQQSSFLQSPQQQPMSPSGYNAAPGYISPQQTTSPFQPTSFFGQQLAAAQVNGGGYGYLQGQNSSSNSQAYNPVQQQLQNNPGYSAQFDPYASIGQGWDGSSSGQQQQQQSQTNLTSPSSATSTTSYGGSLHPREYIRSHKAEIESWDTYAWKQLLGCFDTLKEAWASRKKEIENQVGQLQMQMQYGGGGYHPMQIQQEIGRLQGAGKEAESHADSVAASSFQIHEVFESYRQSGDQASKRRVREASNASLQSLPDWPPNVY